jgi:hypothetical protein
MLSGARKCRYFLFSDDDQRIYMLIATDHILPSHHHVALRTMAQVFHRGTTRGMKVVKSRLVSRYGSVEFDRHC